MPSKRKRPAAGGERQSEEREESPAPSVQKRRKKLHYEPTEICQELYETIRNHKSEEGRLICEAFIRVPKRRTAADYYDVVATPIDLLKIQQKIKTDEYDDIDLMTSDIELMLNNAKSYYKKSSQEYKDACDLLELFHDTKSDLLADAFGEEPVRPERRRSLRQSMHDVEEDMEENPENSNDSLITEEKDDPEDIEQLFAAVMTSKDGDRDISTVFHLLPQKSKYPEYYQIIKNPIDMKMIAHKIKDSRYNTFDDIEKDFFLMVKNAKTFNEPKSQIYKDAVTVKKIVQTKKQELQQKKNMVPKPPERVRTRNLQKMSTICAALKYPSDDEEDLDTSQDANSSQLEYDDDSGAETVMSEEDNTHWSLLNAVKQHRIPSGETIYEPFNKLPSRRFYPDYYEEIAKPMSLSHIRKKMKFNQYRSLEDVASDLNLVFENAKQYNADESILYQHAVLLQKAMWERKKELEKTEGKDFSLEEMSSSQFDIPVTKISRELFDEDSQTSSSSRNRRSGGSDSDRKRAKRATPEEMMKRRLWTLYKSVYDYTDSDSRPLRYIFMQLPSKRDYPDYYQVIAQPIDLSMIEAKLRSDKYPSEQHLIADFELLFNNARHYNEEESVVYQDADQLEKVLKTKWKQICHHIESRRAALSKSRLKAKSQTQLPVKLQEMYDAVSCYQDVKGRTLSTPFLKLPLKTEYPDYYEVIKKPIDMQRIVMKMQQNQYECVEDMTADFVQMFDNACKYNEPDSLIYKDALTLQRLVLEKKMELTDDGTNDVPGVKAFVQELMTSLFISTYNHQDEEGRCYSDSFAELPERDPDEDLATSKEKEKPLSFDQIKKNLDKGRYIRMDRFQVDIFKVFERARKLSRTDSQLYEDAVEMQIFFIRKRDEICKNGEILLTPALSYQEKHLYAALEEEKQEKQNQEQKEDEEKRSKRDSEERMLDNSCSSEGSEDSFKYKEQTFHVGDFVYIEPREKGLEAHIMCVEKMFVDNNDIQTLHGNWYYRPNETFHLATRKFLEKEVFKSDFYTSIPLTQVLGKCYVMYVKDYFKSKPQEFDNKDVYVCESRYNNRHKCFKKIKIWQVPGNDHVTIVPRDIPLVPVRVASVFADKKEEDLDDGETGILDKERENVPIDNPNAEDGCSYFEQLQTPYGTYKIGDCLYLNTNAEFPLICKIEKIWIACGEPYFTGTGFVRPADIPHSPTRLFYRHELFLSSLEAVYPMSRILKKCSVLHIKEYVMGRITEVLEEDTYLCESKYQETDRIVKKLGKGFKKHGLSPLVTDDEIYFFKKPITPQKEPSPLLLKAADDSSFLDDSQDSNLDPMDDSVLSFDTDGQLSDYRPIKKNFEDFTPIPDRSTKKNTEEFTPISEKPAKKKVEESTPNTERPPKKKVEESTPNTERPPKKKAEESTPNTERPPKKKAEDSTPNTERPPKKAKSSMKRQISGYIVYSGEIRKLIQQENPDCSFGEISRIVGGKDRRARPPSGYILFSKASRKQIQEESPQTSFGEVSRLVGAKWRNLCKEEKEKYEEKAKKIAEEQQAKQQEAEKAFNESLQNRSQSPWDYGGGGRMSPGTSNRPTTPGSMHNGMHPMTPIQRMGNMSPMRPYMPPYQPGTPGMRPMMSLGPVPAGAYPGTPQGQPPNQSSLTPQNSMSVLPPHPGMSSGPYPSSKSPGPQQGSMGGTFSGMPTSSHASMQPNISMPGQQMAPPPPPPPPRPPSPMFVSVPPRTQRLLHSEAYLRYIEGLNSEKQTISDWDKILTATPENTQTDESRLPTHWLAEGAGYHGSVTNALWALRDLMLKDTMNISRTLPFEALCK